MTSTPKSEAQTQRAVFGAVALLVSVVVLGNVFGNLGRGESGTVLVLPAIAGFIVLSLAVYLGIRFFQHRRK